MIDVIFDENQKDGYEISDLFSFAAEVLSQDESFQVDVSFLNSKEMRELNLQTRGIDKPTDVLSYPALQNIFDKKIKKEDFPYDIDMQTNNICLGSIAICLDIARSQSEEFGHSIKREVCYLALHGLLHLFGFDHMGEEDKKAMRETEEKILNSKGILRGET